MRQPQRSDREAWDNNAAEWAARVNAGMDLSREQLLVPSILQLLEQTAAVAVLDAGSGCGSIRKQVSDDCWTVALDHSLGMCREARASTGPTADAVCGDLQFLPFQASSFDCVVASMVLHCVSDLGGALAEIARVLKPEGFLIFSMLNPARVMPAQLPREAQTESVIEVERYNVERRLSASIKVGGPNFLPTQTAYYHRRLSTYSAILRANSFVTLDIQEPTASREAMRAYSDMRRFWERSPFVVWFARKTGCREGIQC